MGKAILTQGLSALLQLSCCNWTPHIRKGWECCGCSPWRREGSGPSRRWAQMAERGVQRSWNLSLLSGEHWAEVMGMNWNTDSFLWAPGDTSLLWGQLSIGTGFPERLQHLHPWRYSKVIWVWSRTTGLRWSLALLDQWGWTRLPLRPLPPSDILRFSEPNWQEEKLWRS